MRTIEYALKGKEVPAALSGTAIKIRVAENIQDGVQNKIWASEAAACEKANDGVVISLQGLLRGKAGKAGMTAEQLQAFADGYTYDVRQEGTGVKREVKPETKVQRKAADIGNKMFDRALVDETYRNRLIKAGAFEQADLDEYAALKVAVPSTETTAQAHAERV